MTQHNVQSTDDYRGPAPAMLKTSKVGGVIRIETPQRPLDAWPIEINRPTGKTVGGMLIVEGTGRFRSDRLRVHCGGESCSINAAKDSVDAQLRRMRPQEFEQLLAIDAELLELKRRRGELIRDAFRKGHTITVKELAGLAAQHRARRGYDHETQLQDLRA